MEEKILLRLRYIHKEYVDIVVDDPDKCNLMDVLVDLIEGSAKIGMFLPENPTLWYAHNSQRFQLESDSDIVKLFTVFSDKTIIKLAIGTSELPSKSLESARRLIESKRFVENSVLQMSSHGSHSTSSRRVPATSARRKGICVKKSVSSSPLIGSHHVSGDLSRIDVHVPEIVLDGAVLPGVVLPEAVLPEVVLHEVVLPEVALHETLFADANLLESALPTLDARGAIHPYVHDSEPDFDFEADSEVDSDADGDGIHEDYFDRLYDNGEVYAEHSFGRIKLKPWMIFQDKDHVMDVLRDFCVQDGFTVVVLKSDNKRYTAVCGDSNCDWRIHASMLSDEVTWAIKTLNEKHTCLKVGKYNSMATPEWAAKKILGLVRGDTEVKGANMQSFLFEQYGINMKSTSLYKARKLAVALLKGDDDTSYGSLPGYCEVLKISNPDSVANIVWKQCEGDPGRPIQFKNVFIALKPMIDGFIRGCRSLIGVDGAHLKGRYNGVILSAIGVDVDKGIFPIAFGVYQTEDKETWASFFYRLKALLSSSNRNNWCIVSDRQKGVESALKKMWSDVSRRYCGTHLCANFKKDNPGKPMRNLFWNCCKAFSEYKFKKAMEEVEAKAGKKAIEWLKKRDFECWARCKYDPTLHAPHTSSNFVESFNSTLGAERGLPILSLLEGIRRTIMGRHCLRQEEAMKMPVDGITEHARRKLEKAETQSRSLKIFKVSSIEYEVTEGQSSLGVNMEKRTCGCGEWQIRGIPCRHAVRAIRNIRAHPEHYVSHWYSTKMYKIAYSVNYRPVPDEEQWPRFDLPRIDPPSLRRGVGRPPTKRRRTEDEGAAKKRSRVVRCGRCKDYGHNVKTCKGGATARERNKQGIRVQRNQKKKAKEVQSVENVMCSAPLIRESQ